MKNFNTQITIKKNTGYLVEIEEIATGRKFYGYEEAVKNTGLSKQALLNHTKGKTKK